MKNYTELKSDLSMKVAKAKEKTKKAAIEAANWAVENKEVVIALAPVAIGMVKGTKSIVHSVDRKMDIRKEQNLKDLYIYDRSMGRYLKLRKKLSSNEQLEIERRKRNGESLCSILASMKLLA